MARSTKASNAVLRLKDRSNNAPYSMVSTANAHFYLILNDNPESPQQLCEPLEIDAFVQFVNNIHKQAPRRASKFDIAFEAKLQASNRKE